MSSITPLQIVKAFYFTKFWFTVVPKTTALDRAKKGFTMKYTTNSRPANFNDVSTLAKFATFGTLKRVHSSSGHDRIRELMQWLSVDIYHAEHVEQWHNSIAELTAERNSLNALIADLTADNKRKSATEQTITANNAIIVGLTAERNSLTDRIKKLESAIMFSYSDAFDLYQTAQAYFIDRFSNSDILIVCDEYDTENNEYHNIIVQDDEQNTIDITTKRNGEQKKRNILQSACSAVRKEIYANRGICGGNVNYTYVSDVAGITADDDENSIANKLDTVYFRSGKWYEMPSIVDFEQQAEIIEKLNLTAHQNKVLHYRLQGFSWADIAEKMHVSKPAVAKVKKQLEKKAVEIGLDRVK